MKKLILIAGVAALATTAPLAAKPDHAKGQGHGKHGSMKHAGAHAKGSSKASRGIVTSDRYGNLYALDARGSCPPGLAKKNNGCIAPGQAKKLFNVGQRYNRNAGNMWDYNQIPDALRYQYGLDQSDRYYYNNGYLYQVDPQTSLVERVISAILR
jgi:opacity protein-like surface antigen